MSVVYNFEGKIIKFAGNRYVSTVHLGVVV